MKLKRNIRLILNIRLIIRIYGFIVLLTGIAMLPAVAAAFIYGENTIGKAFLFTSIFAVLVSALTILFVKPHNHYLRTRDGFFIVGFGWILVCLVGCIPYLASGYTASFCSAFFESAAGFTTTGATVFNLENTPKAFLLWKAVSHWLGGMGILVFTVSLLPTFGAGSHKIFKAEIPSLKMDKIVSKISDSAKILYLMYIGFTILQFVLLSFSNMNTFDAIVCTLGCISTAGLSSHTAGLAFFNSIYVESVVAVFTILASINFSMYALVAKRNFKEIFCDIELRTFLSIIAVGTVLVSASLYFSGTIDSASQALRYAFFQVTSFSSTTGYTLADYSSWPSFCLILFFILMLIGGCAFSTSGSVKVIRVIVIFKLAIRSIYRRIHPRAVIAVKLGGKPVSAEVASQVTSFALAFLTVLLFGTLFSSLQGFDFITNLSAALSMLSNTGIAFGEVGPAGNFSMFAEPLQLVLALLMIIGRLEIFTLLVLMTPSFWRPDKAAD